MEPTRSAPTAPIARRPALGSLSRSPLNGRILNQTNTWPGRSTAGRGRQAPERFDLRTLLRFRSPPRRTSMACPILRSEKRLLLNWSTTRTTFWSVRFGRCASGSHRTRNGRRSMPSTTNSETPTSRTCAPTACSYGLETAASTAVRMRSASGLKAFPLFAAWTRSATLMLRCFGLHPRTRSESSPSTSRLAKPRSAS